MDKSEILWGDLRTFLEEGQFLISSDTITNYRVTETLYSANFDRLIATSFRKNPANYIGRDLASRFNGGSFVRLTCDDVCDETSTKRVRESLRNMGDGRELIVVPKSRKFARFDGLFGRFDDKSYVSFVEFPGLEEEKNSGLIFDGKIAEMFYGLYDGLISCNSRQLISE